VQTRGHLIFFANGKKKNHRDKERRREKGDAAFFVRVRDRQRETDTGVEKKRIKRAKEVSQRETERCLRAYLMIVSFFVRRGGVQILQKRESLSV
jgi:hypothetical protein